MCVFVCVCVCVCVCAQVADSAANQVASMVRRHLGAYRASGQQPGTPADSVACLRRVFAGLDSHILKSRAFSADLRCVWKRESLCVSKRERERERERVCAGLDSHIVQSRDFSAHISIDLRVCVCTCLLCVCMCVRV